MTDNTCAEQLDDVWVRLLDHGAEFEDGLSNHGPMAVEAMIRRGHDASAWVERYRTRLFDVPMASDRITAENWRDAWGARNREGDWNLWFREQLAQQPWEQVLAVWWSRLLPGLLGGAAHGVIRVGHAVRAMRIDGPTPVHLAELARALAYWAACGVTVEVRDAAGSGTPDQVLTQLPLDQAGTGRIGARLTRVLADPNWHRVQAAVALPATPQAAETFLRQLVTSVVRQFPARAGKNPVMLVHGATAPHAVWQALPALPATLWSASAAAAWHASAAIHSMYASDHTAPSPSPWQVTDPDEAFARAVEHGDEHAIKLADTVLSVHEWTADPSLLRAIETAVSRIEP